MPPLSSVASPGNIADGDSVFVPKGVMSEKRLHYYMNDHVFLCPRRLCAPYFVDAVDLYQQCGESTRLKHAQPPQKWLFNRTCSRRQFCHLQSSLIDVAYTIARREGPQCERLYSAGHLW
eukprot:UN0500